MTEERLAGFDFSGKSTGKGLGQQTGGDSEEDWDQDADNTLTDWERSFLKDLKIKLVGTFVPTGRVLFKLRDIKDKLVEKGLI